MRNLALVCCIAGIGSAALAGPADSVVRITNYSQGWDWSSPWDAGKVTELGGSGFVIKDGQVLTNAHVVSDSRLLLIHVSGDPEPHEAEVLHLAHDCDLAVVRPRDPTVLRNVPRLDFGGLPQLGSSVDTLGYPSGGRTVASTRGVVSRIEEQLYVHSGVDGHLAVQTDAAINPGSSGGPVLQRGRVVGVAFQTDTALENVGFFIPVEVIERFFRDIEDGRYDGYPDLGVVVCSMEHPALRARAGMREDETGATVCRTARGSSAEGRIQVGDVILAVNGHNVANDGSVVDGEGRVPFGLLVDRMFIGETAVIRILRSGERRELSIPLQRLSFADSRRHAYEQTPRYYVYGGLVFVPLCRETMGTYGQDWRGTAPAPLLDEYSRRFLVEPELQLLERVVLLRRLDDPVNAEMAWFRDQIVERVNGRRITDLASLIEAFEGYEGEYHLIEFAHARRFGVLDRRMAEAANAGILDRYGIQSDRSP
jgi:S1-C subfamily serine protease